MIIKNMSIINSTFHNGYFLDLTNVNMANFTLHIENLHIFNSQFENYDFLFISGNYFKGNL